MIVLRTTVVIAEDDDAGVRRVFVPELWEMFAGRSRRRPVRMPLDGASRKSPGHFFYIEHAVDVVAVRGKLDEKTMGYNYALWVETLDAAQLVERGWISFQMSDQFARRAEMVFSDYRAALRDRYGVPHDFHPPMSHKRRIELKATLARSAERMLAAMEREGLV